MSTILELPPPSADKRIKYGSEICQFGDLRLPPGKGPHPVIIYIHGGFWRSKYDLTHAGHACGEFTRAGFATWNLEYRRMDEPGPWSKTMDDVLLGAQFVKQLAGEYNLDLGLVVAAGHSAGGHLALWLAAQSNAPALRGVVSLAGVCDLRRAWELKLGDSVVEQFMGGSPEQMPERYQFASPIELLPINVPQRLIHGTADVVVPLEISDRFARSSKNAELITLEGADHMVLIDPGSKEWPVVLKGVTEW